jgi:murein DD-endopeptidase MepM/ murein hydrolase activator NlpD
MRFFKRVLNHPLIWLLLLMLLAAGGGYWLFGLGEQSRPSQTVEEIQIIATADFSGEPQPIAPFAAVDPAVMAALLKDNPLTNPANTSLLLEDVPAIGVYLPSNQAEEPAFELETIPALSPLNNKLLESEEDVPVVSPLAGSTALLEYAGDGCAPAGLPVSGVLTQRYHAYHTAIDIGVPIGTPVQATHSGTVVFAGWSAYGYGYLVILQNEHYITYYAHLTNFNVKGGDQVGAGSIIAWSGSTGNSTGPHVHYETRIDDVPVDPLTFEQRGLGFC